MRSDENESWQMNSEVYRCRIEDTWESILFMLVKYPWILWSWHAFKSTERKSNTCIIKSFPSIN